MIRFAGLGILNSRRNLNRSLMTLAVMAMAGLMMTASLSVRLGYTTGVAAPYRAFLGGDIIIYPGRVLAEAAHLAPDEQWVWWRDGGDITGPLAYFHPTARHPGLVQPLDTPREFARSARGYHDLVAKLAGVPGVAQVTPYWTIPIPVLHPRPGAGAPTPVLRSVLRAKEVGSESGLARLIEEHDLMLSGRYFEPEDDGRMVALVDANRQLVDGTGLSLGQRIQLVLPRPFRDAEGTSRLDYTRPTTVELTIIGTYQLPSRSLIWEEETPAGPVTRSEQLFFVTPEIIVPQGTMERIVNLATGAGDLAEVLSPAAILVTVDNFAFVEAMVSQLQALLPETSVVSVPQEVARANLYGLPEPIFQAPPALRPVHRLEDLWPGQWGRSVDVSPLLNTMLFLVAALVAATNATILVLDRRRELGVLKAVGARSQDIVVMIMTEVMVLAFIGATLGFLVVRAYGTIVLITTGTPWQLIARLAWQEWLMVLGITGSVSLAFSLIPALSTLRMTASEVLRLQ
jgi:hypothetical protein